MKTLIAVFFLIGLMNAVSAQEVRYKSDLQNSKVLWFGYYLFSFG